MLNVSFFPFVNFSCCKQNSAMVIKNSPASIKGRLPLKSLVLCLLYHRWTTSHCWNRLYRSKVCNRPKEKCDQSVYFPPCNDRPITKHELRCLYKYNCGLQCCCKISDKEHQFHRDGCPWIGEKEPGSIIMGRKCLFEHIKSLQCYEFTLNHI